MCLVIARFGGVVEAVDDRKGNEKMNSAPGMTERTYVVEGSASRKIFVVVLRGLGS